MSRKFRFSYWTHFALQTCIESVLKVRSLAGKGTHVVGGRIKGYRGFDPEIIAVDKIVENHVLSSLKKTGKPVAVLTEETGRLNLNSKKPGDFVYVVCDPFDGSALYRRQIPAFWFTALSVWDKNGKPITAVVANILTGQIDFCDGNVAMGAILQNRRLMNIHRLKSRTTTQIKESYIESYLMKPEFMYPSVHKYQPIFSKAKLILPNGGPSGFANVANGSTDIYLAHNEAATEIFTGLPIALAAGIPVKTFDGKEIQFQDNIHGQYSIVVTCTDKLMHKILPIIKNIHKSK